MKKKKPIYGVYCTTEYGMGLQPVRADNAVSARKKFKKRFPKQKILSCEKMTDHKFLSHAI